jgi:exodeoxyribonuclease-3
MFRVVTFNANGIRAATRKGFFRWMDALRPDIVCMQETKAQEHQIPPEAIDLPNYHVAFVDAQKKGYSGVAIYSRRKPLEVVRGLDMPDMDAEGRFVTMHFGDLRVSSLYVPSGTSGPIRQAVKYAFLDRFIARMAQLRSDGIPTIVCGDYNIAHREIDVFDPVACSRTTGFLPDERRWFDDVVDRVGWVDAFRCVNSAPREYSWWSNWPQAFERNLGWRIDYQLVTPELASAVRAASIYRDERFSDHAPVTIDYDWDGLAMHAA